MPLQTASRPKSASAERSAPRRLRGIPGPAGTAQDVVLRREHDAEHARGRRELVPEPVPPSWPRPSTAATSPPRSGGSSGLGTAACARSSRPAVGGAVNGSSWSGTLDRYCIGGPPTVENISLRCRRHNVYESGLIFGPYGASIVREGREPYDSDRSRTGMIARPPERALALNLRPRPPSVGSPSPTGR